MGRRRRKLQYRKIFYIFFFLVFIVFISQFFVETNEFRLIENATYYVDDIFFELVSFEYGDSIDDEFQYSLLKGRINNNNDYNILCNLFFHLKNESSIIESFNSSLFLTPGNEEEFEMDIKLFIGNSTNDFSFDCFKVD